MQAHLFYHIDHRYSKLIPLDVYKDNVVILTRTSDWLSNERKIELNFKYYSIDLHYLHKDLYLYKLSSKDILHLNLLGIPITPSSAVKLPGLPLALKHKQSTYNAKPAKRP